MIVRINHRQSHLIAKLNTDYTHSLINKIGQNRTQAKRRESKNQNRRTERVVNQHKQGAAEHKSKGSRYKINPFRNLEPSGEAYNTANIIKSFYPNIQKTFSSLFFQSSMAPNRHMTCVLKVDTQSSGWEKSVTKVIKRVKDVSYTIDTTRGYVHISGTINPQKLLTDVKKVGKAGRRAELVHVDCGGNSYSHSNYGSYGYHGYNGGYGYSDPYHHTYHHYVPRPGAYLQSHHARVLPLPPPPPPPTSYAYDPYYPNPSWNLM